MSDHEIKPVKISVTPSGFLKALEDADVDDDGQLNGVRDNLPRFQIGSAVLLAPPVVQAWFRRLKRGDFANLPAKIDLEAMGPSATKSEIGPEEIVALMKANGGHLIKLKDLARLYPKAKIRGEGHTLEELSKMPVQTNTHGKGTKLGEAFLDPGGDLIVSHLYGSELKAAAPSFTQFMTNRRGVHPNPVCHTAAGFLFQECHPDSWPVSLDALLSVARLNIPFKAGIDSSMSRTWRRAGLVQYLWQEAPSLPGVRRLAGGVELNLREEGAVRGILNRLNDLFPDLLCDPSSEADISYHLGRRLPDGRVPGASSLRRVLLAIFDDPSVSVAYDSAEVGQAWFYNQAAFRVDGGPSLHFLARISPADPDRVIFGILHFDAQSYRPRGAKGLDRIIGPDESGSVHQPQHQGEVEPLYLVYRRYANSPHLERERAFLGDHLVAEPLAGAQYSEDLAVAYGSGGRIVMREQTTWLPGMMMGIGAQSGHSALLSTTTGIFPFVEVYPGRSDLEGAHPTAARFTRDNYKIILEGEDGDFLPTGRFLSRNGQSGDEALNTAGLPWVRGSGEAGSRAERTRTEVNFRDFLARQDEYHTDRLMGGAASLYYQFSSTGFDPDSGGDLSRSHWVPFTDVGTRFSFRYEPRGPFLFPRPLYVDVNYFWPFHPLTREVPPFAADLYSVPDQPMRFRTAMELGMLRAGFLGQGVDLYLQGRVGPHVFGAFDEAGPFGTGTHEDLGFILMFHRGSAEFRLGTEVQFEQNVDFSGRYLPQTRWFPLTFGIGGRLRRYY